MLVHGLEMSAGVFNRYSDFLVNEVNNAGEIVCITEQMVPHEPEEIPCKS